VWVSLRVPAIVNIKLILRSTAHSINSYTKHLQEENPVHPQPQWYTLSYKIFPGFSNKKIIKKMKRGSVKKQHKNQNQIKTSKM
jgi:hypothetical protein